MRICCDSDKSGRHLQFTQPRSTMRLLPNAVHGRGRGVARLLGTALRRRIAAVLVLVCGLWLLWAANDPQWQLWRAQRNVRYGDRFSTAELRRYLGVEPAQSEDIIRCRRQSRLGSAEDGGWELCLDSVVAAGSGNCVVYSFGIRWDFTFDESAAALGCEVHAFDPSMSLSDGLLLDDKSPGKIFFHQLGLGDHDGSIETSAGTIWQLKTLATIMKDLNHRAIPVLKFDIEWNEWDVFKQWMQEWDAGEMARVIPQMMTEIHFEESTGAESDRRNTERLETWKQFLKHTGYVVWRGDENYLHGLLTLVNGRVTRCCYEVTLLHPSNQDRGVLGESK